MDEGDGEFTRELDLGYIPDSGVDVLWGTISVNVGEEVRWLNRVVSSTRPGEVVRGGD